MNHPRSQSRTDEDRPGARRAFRIRPAQSEHDLSMLYRFRYRIYVEEMARPQHHADHAARWIRDPLDDHGINLVAWDDEGEVIGAVRANFARRGDLNGYESFYAMQVAEDAHPRSTSITTRLMVHTDYRRSTLPLALSAAVYRVGLEHGMTHNFIDCNAHLVKFFERLGFIQHLPRKEHPEYGEVTCMVLQLRDREHLARMRSPLLVELARRDARDGHRESPPPTAEAPPAARNKRTGQPMHAIERIEAEFDVAFRDFSATCAMTMLREGRITVAHYASILREIYFYSREDPQIQAAATLRFRGEDRALVRTFLRHAMSEVGHENLALADLERLGEDVSQIPLSRPLPSTIALTAYPVWQIEHQNVVGYLGYLYFLEHVPTRAGGSYREALAAAGVPDDAMSFLHEHSTVDVAHNKLMRQYLAGLVRTESDLDAVVCALHVTAHLYGVMLDGAVRSTERYAARPSPVEVVRFEPPVFAQAGPPGPHPARA